MTSCTGFTSDFLLEDQLGEERFFKVLTEDTIAFGILSRSIFFTSPAEIQFILFPQSQDFFCQ